MPSAVCVPVNRHTLAFVAACQLDPGDEITDTYVNLLQCLRDRQQELSEQKGFRCKCGRCSVEAAALPDSVAGAVLHRFKTAHGLGTADDFLRAAGGVRQFVRRTVEAAVEGEELQHMLRASLLVADVGTVIVYESPQCALSGRDEDCAEAAWQLCLALEQVAPLSKDHVQFAERHAQHCFGKRRPLALAYFFVVWLLRFGSIELHRSGGGSLLAASAAQRCHLIRTFSHVMRRPAADVGHLQKECEDGFSALTEKVGAYRFGSVRRFIAQQKCCDLHAITSVARDRAAHSALIVNLNDMD